jgi:hypothetical protein
MIENGDATWKPEGSKLLSDAAANLVGAIAAHNETLQRAQGNVGEVVQAGEKLLPFAIAYASAQMQFTGTAYPFAALEGLLEDEDDDEEEEVDDLEEQGAAEAISVIERRDYHVIDQQAVISSGQAAYVQREGVETSQAVISVDHVGVALYELAHGRGWHALGDTPGLQIIGGVTIVVENDDPLSADPDRWPDDPTCVTGPVIYRQEDVY